MIIKRILAVVGAVALAGSLAAGPAQAASDSGARSKARTHLSLKTAADPSKPHYKVVATRLTRAGHAYANKRVIIQYKSGGHWRKLRGIPAMRTDANGVAGWSMCAYPRRVQARVHFGGDRKSKPADSRSYRTSLC